MVKITNGERTIIVTTGAYREMYAPQGYKIVDEGKETTFTEEIPNTEEKTAENIKNEPSDNIAEDSIDQEDSKVDSEEVMKPFSEMNVNELKQFAQEHEIDISSAKNKQDMKAIISAEMEE